MSERRPIDLDRDRATVLLLINSLLIKKAYHIYVSILSNQQALLQLLPQGRQLVFEQYNNLNRRLQCNLLVLSFISDLYHNKAATQQPNRLKFPVILSAPTEMPELRHLYKRLQDLYPDALQFLKMKIHQMKMQQELRAAPPAPAPQQRAQNHTSIPQAPPPSQQPPPTQAQNFNQFNAQPQYNSSQVNLLQRRAPPAQAAPPNVDMGFNASISPQMVAKEPDMLAFGGSFAGGFQNSQTGPMLSISPHQILQQQSGNNDFSMDFF